MTELDFDWLCLITDVCYYCGAIYQHNVLLEMHICYKKNI